MLISVRLKCTMTDGPMSIAGILAFYCFFLTAESIETLRHSGMFSRIPTSVGRRLMPGPYVISRLIHAALGHKKM
jgi:hypothetical protein